eukprot:GHUV01027782.1.p1 GENE.GHUV01027782.1~~GHUV01027782.1.p1  ORF type:complete len:107 (-),score=27.45 GHUV01027782.1:895-1215(-)
MYACGGCITLGVVCMIDLSCSLQSSLSLVTTPAVQARGMADFLLPLLHFDPSERATAAEALKHPWLEGPPEPAAAVSRDDGRRSHRRNSSAADRSRSPDAKRSRYY